MSDSIDQPVPEFYEVFRVVDHEGKVLFTSNNTFYGLFDAFAVLNRLTKPQCKVIRISDGKTMRYISNQKLDLVNIPD